MAGGSCVRDRTPVAALARSKHTIERLLLAKSSIDKSRESSVWVRADASFIYVNDAACEAFGYTHDEFSEMHVWDLDANVTEVDFRRIRELVERRGHIILRTQVRLRDGGAIPAEVGISHVNIRNEGFQCAVIHDLSELRETEKRLQDCEERERRTLDLGSGERRYPFIAAVVRDRRSRA